MNAVIIVAGGKGLRMGGDVPKQFLPVGGRPVLMRTVDRFLEYDPTMQVVLVLPRDQHDYWRALCRQHSFAAPVAIATGGDTRFHSVKNGLACISPHATLIGVHDGVRPFASVATIARCYSQAAVDEAVVPVVPVVETIRRLHPATEQQGTAAAESAPSPAIASQAEKSIPCPAIASQAGKSVPCPAIASQAEKSVPCPAASSQGASVTVPRDAYRLVQTPQVFSAALLRRAYRQPFRDAFTDDASVVESLPHPIALVEGNRENIKITTPFDLVVAEALTGH